MRRICAWILSLSLALVLGGCASLPYMPLSEPGTKADTSPPLYLMTVSIKNTYKERWQPVLANVLLTRQVEGGKTETRQFVMDRRGVVAAKAEGDSTLYLVRLRAADGFNTVHGFNAVATAFPAVGFFFLPLHAGLGVDAPGIYYLGAVQATIRERKDNEFRAGPVLPLIDQAVAGASGGTFEVSIVDRFEQDLPLFLATFPALADTPVTKRILPAWDRAKAQLAWENN